MGLVVKEGRQLADPGRPVAADRAAAAAAAVASAGLP
jgi:hypothetical protein